VNITLHQLFTLNAVITQGSIQSGAKYLNKTHPSVITALKKLENELNFSLFDRTGYRITLTKEGRVFYKSAQRILDNINELGSLSLHLENNEETELNIAIGDITPLGSALSILRTFSRENTFTHLNLLFDNLEGVNERLLNGQADLIVHHIDKSDIRYEYKDFGRVEIIAVVAPEFLTMPVHNRLKYSNLVQYTQCVIRDTTEKLDTKNHFVSEHSPTISVGDQHTKKEIIKQGMAWGHMPSFLIETELESGELISINSDYIKTHIIDLVVSRLHKVNHGIMAEKLWNMF